jgi:hypothetical protein
MKFATLEGSWFRFKIYIEEKFTNEEFEKLGFLINNQNLENTTIIIGSMDISLLTRIAVDYRLTNISNITYYSINNYFVYGNYKVFPTNSIAE